MDSMDAYQTLIHSLSSTLRKILISEVIIVPNSQGCLELASARHAMGASRVNTVLLDHKFHPAATSLLVTQDERKGIYQLTPWNHTLHYANEHLLVMKSSCWERCNLAGTSCNHSYDAGVVPCFMRRRPHLRIKLHLKLMTNFTILEIAHLCYLKVAVPLSFSCFWKRCKSLSVFGTLVSPKLRAAQLSFETALETLVEIANKRSAMLCAFNKVHKKLGGSSMG
ncbi:hypothetical protein CRYUN_Cryun30bG0003200 [Craigia yunnanensis]